MDWMGSSINSFVYMHKVVLRILGDGMSQPLRNKLCIDTYEGDSFFMKADVKSAVEFWYEYRDEPIKFHDDFKTEFEDFLIEELEYTRDSEAFIYLDEYYIEDECKEEFNRWLFRYTFKDVVE